MSAKHTPGPWRATQRSLVDGGNWASRIPFAIEREAGAAVLPIADVCDQPNADANARLIAAAPDLLEALQAALEWIDAVPSDTVLPTMPGFDRDWANGVIAKATGADK